MKILPRIAAVVGLALPLITSSASAAPAALEGNVRDANGHLLQGAEVRIQGRDAGKFATTKTDAAGHYSYSPLEGGTYIVSLMVDGVTKAAISNFTTQEGKTATLNFELSKGGSSRPYAKGRHYVLIQNTGSHLPQWVEVADNQGSIGAQRRMESSAGESIRQIQAASGNAVRQ